MEDMASKSVTTKTAETQPDPAAIAPRSRMSLVRTFAARLGVEPEKLIQTLKDTAFKQPHKDGKAGPEVTDSQMMALLVVANEYGLSPFLKEIYAFPAKGGGIVPVVSVDGWIKIINSRPELKSIEFDYPPDSADRADYYVGCTIDRHDRAKPISVREYFAECYRNTDPWNSHGRRMTRHKALIQCARIAFGFGGIYDPDEADRIANALAIDVTPQPNQKPATEPPKAIASDKPALANEEQLKHIREKLSDTEIPMSDALGQFQLEQLEALQFDQVQPLLDWIAKAGK